MTTDAEAKLEGTTLVVRIPMHFQRRGGRKRIVAPDGGELAPATEWRRDQGARAGVAVAAAARRGQFASVRELAEAERIGLSYISRVLRLTLLAPDIMERILDGRPTADFAQLMKPFPVAWERQREALQVTRPHEDVQTSGS
jgi:hypothetical protein